jgi:AraC family transcriptional regulator
VTKYNDRFVGVLNHIEANLDIELDIEELCQLSYLSKFHFHRQCSAFFGMPVMSLVKLLRLKRAAYQVAYRNEKIVDIALANGYESHEAFTRAFKKKFKKSPSDFRRSPDWTLWHTQYDPILKLRTRIMSNNVNSDVNIVDFPKTLIATIEHRAPPNLLGHTIKKFIEWRKINRLPPSKSKTFNLVYDDPNITLPENYRFDVCCSIEHMIEENTHGIVNKVIPAGKCAVLRHIGSDDSIGLVVQYLYSEWLNNADWEIRDFPIFFERVSFFPEVSENEMVTDVYLPIEKIL